MAEAPKEKMSASKVLAFIGMLFTLSLGIAYFYGALADPLYVLWGIICLIIAFLIFYSLELISFGKFKIPYTWWMLLIYGVVLVIFVMFFNVSIYPGAYFPAVLLLMAFLIEIMSTKKAYKVSKMVALLGCAFAVYDCILLFATSAPLLIVNGIFGLAMIVVFILVIFDLFDFKIFDYSWWFVLLVGFVIFTWISAPALGTVAGFGGILILIAFILVLMAY